MNKLTADKCRELIQQLKDKQAHPMKGLTGDEKLYLPALEIALPILEQQEQGEGEWIEWGGKCEGNDQPVMGIVQVKFRGGEIDKGKASSWYWPHDGCASDIIAYRIIPERATNQNGEQ